ncbi:putative phage tail protein [Paenibacillus sanguinis]|uniref:putative phage tail protein n=1 Tax=Paenibacillus sanguinis TaxID=225906 RepID=UPI0003810AD0|nr:putative phage tail protein [Paenibacillus sanguinis]
MPPDRFMGYLPPYYEDVLEFVQLGQTEDIELNQLETAVKQLFADQFVLTSGVQAIKRRELMLGIQADSTTETLEFRKQRILNRYRTKPPFTVRWLQEQLDKLVGPGMTVVSVDPPNFVLYVTTNIENANLFKEVRHTVQTIKPANILYQQNTSINTTIGLEEHIIRRDIGWNYKLNDSWKLGEESFATFGTEVEVT